MKHVIIGTAGHVDHGKTSLIQALTGTNPDRLKEEQARGMTIDLGFAALRLPDGAIAGIVDVPGHERFLKNMLAGASGVDVVLLVIAADESVMPQTVEHLDILRLLDVKNGVVALTKIDLVEKDWADAVEEDVRARLAGSFLADAPIIRVASTTGKGMNALLRALQSAVSRAAARNVALPFRLPVDRVFTRPGFGTVVTGTLVAGTLRVGDAVEIVPQQMTSRVRGLQTHGAKVALAEAGSRVAVNLANVDTETLERGAQLAAPGTIAPTTTFDALLRLLPTAPKPLQDRSRVRLHLGTAEILGRVRFLDARNELEPGGQAYVQFRGETEFAGARGDRFVIRAYSPMLTIGGGVILQTTPARHRKADPAVLAALAAKERGAPEDLVETFLQRCPVGATRQDAVAGSGLANADFDRAVDVLLNAGQVVATPGDRLFHAAVLSALTDRARTLLSHYHEQFPLRSGMPKEEFRAALGKGVEARVFASLLGYWQDRKITATESATVRQADFQVELNARQESLLQRIEDVYRAGGIAPPTIEEVSKDVKAPPDAVTALLRVGVQRQRFVRASDSVYYHADTIQALQQMVREEVARHGSVTVGAFRDLTQTNRKFALQALEYFDSIRFTRRAGDERTLFALLP